MTLYIVKPYFRNMLSYFVAIHYGSQSVAFPVICKLHRLRAWLLLENLRSILFQAEKFYNQSKKVNKSDISIQDQQHFPS